MKDIIAKLQMDANVAMGSIWMHIDSREARIAELEAQLAALEAGPEWIDGRNDDPAEAAFWRFDARKKGYSHWKGAPQSERDAFKAEYRAAASTALQAPVREVPGWQPIETAPKDGTYILAVMQGFVPSTVCWRDYCWMTMDMESAYDDGDFEYQGEWKLTHWMPLPAAPVQQEG